MSSTSIDILNNLSAREAAEVYLRAGLSVVPVPHRKKGCVLDDWTRVQVGVNELDKYFPDGKPSNIGVRNGQASGGLIDVDLDVPQAVDIANKFLPLTQWVSGRESSPRSHRWFKVQATIATEQFKDIDGSMILEIRSDGTQTVLPPSAHSDTGERVIWFERNGQPTEVEAQRLQLDVRRVAAATVISRHWPAKGSRHDAALALAGGLLRAGWDKKEVERFVLAVADAAGDDEARHRVRDVASTAKQLMADSKTTGWPTLSKLLGRNGPEVVEKVRGWLGVAQTPQSQNQSADSGPRPWPDLIPLLNTTTELPPFPKDVLPEWLRSWVEATSVALQVPEDLPAALGLAVCSAGVSQKLVAKPRHGWTEPINTYWVCALPPSDRKTQTVNRALAPVFDIQQRMREEIVPARRDAESRKNALTKRADRLENEFGKANSPEERLQILADLTAVRTELDEIALPPVPQLIVDDETPANLTKVLCEQGGRLLQASAEGTLFENIGRWSVKPEFDIYLKGYSGDPLSVGRVTRERTECRHPALTCVVAPQPAVIEALGDEPSLSGRGFLARWFYCLPMSKVGRRVIAPPPVSSSVRDRYHDCVSWLWNVPQLLDEDGRPKPQEVAFTTEADAVIRDFERYLEPQLAEGAELWFLAGWGGKAAGGAVRLATIMHLADSVGCDVNVLPPVSVDVARRAVRLVRDYMIPHAKAAFAIIGANIRINRARKVVRWLQLSRRQFVSVRDVNQALKGTIKTVDELHPVLDLLEEHGYIRPATMPERGGRGRSRSPMYEVNPEIWRRPDSGRNEDGDGPPNDPPGAMNGEPSEKKLNSEDNENCEITFAGQKNANTIAEPPAVTNAGTALHKSRYSRAGAVVEQSLNSEDIENCETHTTVSSVGIVADDRRDTVSKPRSDSSAHNSQYSQNSWLIDVVEIGDVTALETTSQNSRYPQISASSTAPVTALECASHNSRYPQNSPSATSSGLVADQWSIGYDAPMSDEPTFLVIQSASDLSAAVAAVSESRLVGLDCETTGLNPRTDRIRLLALNCDTNSGGRFTYLVDAFEVDLTPLWQPLADVEIIAHNAAFDLGFLMRLGFAPGRVHDTMILSQILYSSARTKGKAPVKHGLKDCAERELQIKLDKELQASDWSGPLSNEQLKYAAADSAILVPLYQAVTRKLNQANLARTADIESLAIPSVAWMASAGVGFNQSDWQSLAELAKTEAEQFARQLDEVAPVKQNGLWEDKWNWDSPAQVKAAFRLLEIPIKSTSDDVLAAIDHPLADLLRNYREAKKRQTTYGNGWLKHLAADGRVYPQWYQLGANSGRMACGSPNMQNLPRGTYRRCVAAPPGRVLVKADYSQIELRIAAKISGDLQLLAAYQRGDDLHTLTAKNVLGISEVSKHHRQLAKAINFGLLYGMGAKAFRAYAKTNYGVQMSEQESEAYRDAFFRAYPGLRRWHRSVGNLPRDTRTLIDRRVLSVERFSEKLNLPVQGSGADALKIALGLLWQRRTECPGPIPVLAVHDEIVVECAEDHVDKVKDWLRSAMIDAMAPLIAPVPVEVEVKVGRTWAGD